MMVVSRILRHESSKTTVDICGHLQDTNRRQALNSLAQGAKMTMRDRAIGNILEWFDQDAGDIWDRDDPEDSFFGYLRVVVLSQGEEVRRPCWLAFNNVGLWVDFPFALAEQVRDIKQVLFSASWGVSNPTTATLAYRNFFPHEAIIADTKACIDAMSAMATTAAESEYEITGSVDYTIEKVNQNTRKSSNSEARGLGEIYPGLLGQLLAEGTPSPIRLGYLEDLERGALDELYIYLLADLMQKYRDSEEVTTDLLVSFYENGNWNELDLFEFHQSLLGLPNPHDSKFSSEYDQIFEATWEASEELFNFEWLYLTDDGFHIHEADFGRELEESIVEFQSSRSNLEFIGECLELSVEEVEKGSFEAELLGVCSRLLEALKEFSA